MFRKVSKGREDERVYTFWRFSRLISKRIGSVLNNRVVGDQKNSLLELG